MNNHPVITGHNLRRDAHTHDYFRIKVLGKVKQSHATSIPKNSKVKQIESNRRICF